MAENTKTPKPTDTTDRFFDAASGDEPSPDRRVVIATLRAKIIDLGNAIEDNIPAGRNKALALTALEDVQMRATRGLFAPEGTK